MVLQCLDEHSITSVVHVCSNFGSEPLSLLQLIKSYPPQFLVQRKLKNSSRNAYWHFQKTLLCLPSFRDDIIAPEGPELQLVTTYLG